MGKKNCTKDHPLAKLRRLIINLLPLPPIAVSHQDTAFLFLGMNRGLQPFLLLADFA